ncbi:response regulator [Opitutus sp. ER46]|uniref:response regulator n=1 Tax=Opitutus sp. ER46 TaxID=2161864 RepID=UPI000D31D9B3|nr:response regulator [Opitutus sp. ER46]PTX94224.1 hypothetical protein DB354_10690 [Opitutus sp. ER46]
MRILVVDDDDSYRFLMRDALSAITKREHIAFASDGDEAWWILTDPDRSFDILILDIGMPRVNGLALLARIRQHPKLLDLPIILCTGTSNRQTVTEAVKHNVISYVVKPFSPTAMAQKVEEVIAQMKKAV